MNLNTEKIEEIAKLVEGGLTWTDAGVIAGIHPETFHKLILNGKKAKSGLRRKLVQALTMADEKCTQENLRIVMQAARKGKKSSKKWLKERGLPY